MRIGSLFSGYGGLDLGVQSMLGGSVAWHADIDPGACRILEHRYPGVPNLGDVSAVDWSAVEPVDVLTGGFPCQDVSSAGKRAGLRPTTRSGLWAHFAYAIDQLRPGLVVIENVRGLLSADAEPVGDVEPCPWCVGDRHARPLRALGAVLGDLADIGYDARWHGLRAADIGAPHARFRVFVVAHPHDRGWGRRAGQLGPGRRSEPAHRSGDTVPDAFSDGRHQGRPEPARLERRPHAPLGGAPTAADPDRDGLQGIRRIEPGERDTDRCGGADIMWGDYEPSIRRWERLTRPAPAPTEPGRNGPRLSPAFSEWLMGLPAGWVTGVPGLTRPAALCALGNGVVPQQAAAALALLLADNYQETAA